MLASASVRKIVFAMSTFSVPSPLLFPNSPSTIDVNRKSWIGLFACKLMTCVSPRHDRRAPQWGAADAEIKVQSGENTELTATLSARDFLLAYLYPSSPFTCIFFQNLSRFFLCWLWLTHGSCVGPQNEIRHPARGRFPCWVPVQHK